ncbi:BMC domain-containing protein [Cedecea colo]|uniref:BMC domain-containing protein n=1 Tax=Cedecea colo TaxID=2552946 RepID=A0ABX0VR51_9ENTR|nr:BMC domain-containing protein [Cedecea colo]NIY49065.1 BMC domain-containing protein [Cedecea colo]
MKSLGVIETYGLVAAIQAVDAACKAADVTCTGYRKVGGGRVSVCFEGEISAIKTAIERGTKVAGDEHSLSSVVIARPERSAVEKLTTLKGRSTRLAPIAAPAREVETETSSPQLSRSPVLTEEDDKEAIKKGKKK